MFWDGILFSKKKKFWDGIPSRILSSGHSFLFLLSQHFSPHYLKCNSGLKFFSNMIYFRYILVIVEGKTKKKKLKSRQIFTYPKKRERKRKKWKEKNLFG